MRGIRSEALANLTKAATKWQTSGKDKKKVAFSVGDVVSLAVDPRDRSKVDPKRLPCVVVEVTPNGMYRIACAAGDLGCFTAGSLVPHDKQTVNSHVGLAETLKNETRKKVSVKEGVRHISLVGGVGMRKCNCKYGIL